jgi:hypothetical protein
MNNLTETEIKDILLNYEDKEAFVLLGFRTRAQITPWRQRFKIFKNTSHSSIARKYDLNHFFFETIDSEAKAYILGFMAADGNINPGKYGCEVRICLHPKDADILTKINNAWESDYPIRIHHSTEKSGFPGTCREQPKLSVHSAQMEADLARYFIVPSKTATVRFPEIPPSLHRHYLRGLLDGDGYVTKDNFGWVGNTHMMNDIQGACMLHGFKELRKYHIRRTSYNTRGGPSDHALIKWMYEDASIFLGRKKTNFDLLWKDRVYVPKLRAYPFPAKHIPCALESLPPYLQQGSMT